MISYLSNAGVSSI